MSTPTLSSPLRDLTEAAIELARVVEAAEAVQWKPAPVAKPRDDTTERAAGGHGDPTFSTVADERRLAVREAVGRSHYALGLNARALRQMTAAVEAALRGYYGDVQV
jgi:hypothetical protein